MAFLSFAELTLAVVVLSDLGLCGGSCRLGVASGSRDAVDCLIRCGWMGALVDDGIELADLIWQLRHELSRAMWAGEHTDLRFEAGPVELELTVVVEKSSQPGVKAKLVVVDAEWGAKRSSVVTQRIKLTLHPRKVDAPDRPPLISGSAEEGER